MKRTISQEAQELAKSLGIAEHLPARATKGDILNACDYWYARAYPATSGQAKRFAAQIWKLSA